MTVQTNPLDPFSVWKSIYNEMEPKVSSAMQKWLESEEYAEFSGQFLSATLQMEQHFVQVFEQMMHTYTLPTLKDFSRLGEMIVALEDKVETLEEQLDERLSSIESHLLGLTTRLEEIGKGSVNELTKKPTRETSPRPRRRAQTEEESVNPAQTENEDLNGSNPDVV